jgi:hypothetical protein
MEPNSYEEYAAAKAILLSGGAVTVTRYTAGKLRGYFRGRRGETRRVYLVNRYGFRKSPVYITIELREKETNA